MPSIAFESVHLRSESIVLSQIMGNLVSSVKASALEVPAPFPLVDNDLSLKKSVDEEIANPGPMEDLHKKTKGTVRDFEVRFYHWHDIMEFL